MNSAEANSPLSASKATIKKPLRRSNAHIIFKNGDIYPPFPPPPETIENVASSSSTSSTSTESKHAIKKKARKLKESDGKSDEVSSQLSKFTKMLEESSQKSNLSSAEPDAVASPKKKKRRARKKAAQLDPFNTDRIYQDDEIVEHLEGLKKAEKVSQDSETVKQPEENKKAEKSAQDNDPLKGLDVLVKLSERKKVEKGALDGIVKHSEGIKKVEKRSKEIETVKNSVGSKKVEKDVITLAQLSDGVKKMKKNSQSSSVPKKDSQSSSLSTGKGIFAELLKETAESDEDSPFEYTIFEELAADTSASAKKKNNLARDQTRKKEKVSVVSEEEETDATEKAADIYSVPEMTEKIFENLVRSEKFDLKKDSVRVVKDAAVGKSEEFMFGQDKSNVKDAQVGTSETTTGLLDHKLGNLPVAIDNLCRYDQKFAKLFSKRTREEELRKVDLLIDEEKDLKKVYENRINETRQAFEILRRILEHDTMLKRDPSANLDGLPDIEKTYTNEGSKTPTNRSKRPFEVNDDDLENTGKKKTGRFVETMVQTGVEPLDDPKSPTRFRSGRFVESMMQTEFGSSLGYKSPLKMDTAIQTTPRLKSWVFDNESSKPPAPVIPFNLQPTYPSLKSRLKEASESIANPATSKVELSEIEEELRVGVSSRVERLEKLCGIKQVKPSHSFEKVTRKDSGKDLIKGSAAGIGTTTETKTSTMDVLRGSTGIAMTETKSSNAEVVQETKDLDNDPQLVALPMKDFSTNVDEMNLDSMNKDITKADISILESRNEITSPQRIIKPVPRRYANAPSVQKQQESGVEETTVEISQGESVGTEKGPGNSGTSKDAAESAITSDRSSWFSISKYLGW
ncbi:hypothetical protein HK098_000930 [Nowakowskiella sp. JEL0407]|nr:hypothetical protein HK098_000930 [Nowakowskiella sp. JEL0407]